MSAVAADVTGEEVRGKARDNVAESDENVAERQAPVYSEQGRALKKRLQLRKKLEAKKKKEEELARASETAEERKAREVAEKKKAMESAELAATTAAEIEAKQAAPKEAAPRERVKVGGKALVTTEMKLSRAENARLQAKCAAGKAGKIKAVVKQNGVNINYGEENLDADSVLVFTGCEGSTFMVTSHCTKIFIEDCRRCTFRFQGKIITAVLEIDRCEECNVLISSAVGTLQIEQCKRMNVVYAAKELMTGYIVWAGCYTLRVQVGEDLMRCDFALTAAVDKTVNEERTQFKIHYNSLGKLVCDKIIRLKNGFPTTRLEDDEFRRRQEQNMKAIADRMGITIRRKGDAIGTRIKPNAMCPCGSGKKYKKCCRVANGGR